MPSLFQRKRRLTTLGKICFSSKVKSCFNYNTNVFKKYDIWCHRTELLPAMIKATLGRWWNVCKLFLPWKVSKTASCTKKEIHNCTWNKCNLFFQWWERKIMIDVQHWIWYKSKLRFPMISKSKRRFGVHVFHCPLSQNVFGSQLIDVQLEKCFDTTKQETANAPSGSNSDGLKRCYPPLQCSIFPSLIFLTFFNFFFQRLHSITSSIRFRFTFLCAWYLSTEMLQEPFAN